MIPVVKQLEDNLKTWSQDWKVYEKAPPVLFRAGGANLPPYGLPIPLLVNAARRTIYNTFYVKNIHPVCKFLLWQVCSVYDYIYGGSLTSGKHAIFHGFTIDSRRLKLQKNYSQLHITRHDNPCSCISPYYYLREFERED